MLKKYTKTEIKKKSKKCKKCNKMIAIAFVEGSEENFLCSECREENDNEK